MHNLSFVLVEQHYLIMNLLLKQIPIIVWKKKAEVKIKGEPVALGNSHQQIICKNFTIKDQKENKWFLSFLDTYFCSNGSCYLFSLASLLKIQMVHRESKYTHISEHVSVFISYQ
jgi:hypothetical protein